MTPKINLHTHTTFCDGKNSPQEMVESAIQKGFSAIGFSGHCIHPLNPDFYTNVDNLWHIPSANINAYVTEIRRLKEEYADKIEILLGFEAEYFESEKYGSAIPSKQNYSEFKPDYLIGAVHFVNTPKGFYTVDNKAEILKENLINYYGNKETQTNGLFDGKQVVHDYFAAEREMLKKGNFDIIAHPDLIRIRNAALNIFDENENWYKEEVIATADSIAKAGVITEINTGAIARGTMDDTYPSEYFLGLLFERGVPVCINSDAHTEQNLDAAFDRAITNAKKAGYKELIYPIDGKTVSVKI